MPSIGGECQEALTVSPCYLRCLSFQKRITCSLQLA